MATTIGVHVTITNPDKQGYAWKEAIENYLQFADQVVVVDGGSDKHVIDWLKTNYLDIVELPWPQDKWHWSELPKHNQAGYEALDTDWTMRMDIDYLIHENDHKDLRYILEKLGKENWLIASVMKKVILNRNKYYKKCSLPIIINKSRADKGIAYGYNPDVRSDWCFPINPKKQDENGVWTGTEIDPALVYRTGISCWDYDYFFRTKEQAKERFWKFSQGWNTATGRWDWGKDEEDAFKMFCKMGRGRLSKDIYDMSMDSHPTAIRSRIKNMPVEQWGNNNWNNLEGIKL